MEAGPEDIQGSLVFPSLPIPVGRNTLFTTIKACALYVVFYDTQSEQSF